MHVEMWIHMRWKQNVILGSISYPHTSVISTRRNDGHWSHTSLRYLLIPVSTFHHWIRVCVTFVFICLFLYIACNFRSCHTCEFSAYWLRKAGKDKLAEMKVVLISPVSESAHLLQLILLRQETVASIKAGYRHPGNLKNSICEEPIKSKESHRGDVSHVF